MKRFIVAFIIMAMTAGLSFAGIRPDSKKGMYWVSSLAELRTLDITGAGNPNQYDLIENDTAIMINITGTTGTFSLYVFDASSEAAESVPDIIQPSDFATAGNWTLAGLSFLGDDLDLNGYDITGVGVLYPDGYAAPVPLIDDPDDDLFTGNYLFGGHLIANAAGDLDLTGAVVASGQNWTYEAATAAVITVSIHASDTMWYNGAALTAATGLTSDGTVDAIVVCEYKAANTYSCRGTGFSETP